MTIILCISKDIDFKSIGFIVSFTMNVIVLHRFVISGRNDYLTLNSTSITHTARSGNSNSFRGSRRTRLPNLCPAESLDKGNCCALVSSTT